MKSNLSAMNEQQTLRIMIFNRLPAAEQRRLADNRAFWRHYCMPDARGRCVNCGRMVSPGKR